VVNVYEQLNRLGLSVYHPASMVYKWFFAHPPMSTQPSLPLPGWG